MKSFLRLSLFTILSILLSCGVENEGSTNLEQTETPYAKLAIELSDNISDQQPSYLEGKYDSWYTDNQELVVWVETNTLTHIFTLQDATNKERLGNIDGLIYADEFVWVKTNQGKTYYLSPQSENAIKRLPEVKEKLGIQREMSGYGLSHMMLNEAQLEHKELSKKNIQNLSSIFLIGQQTSKSSCQHGGVGATKCSIGTSGNNPGCSVECSGSTYACCNEGFPNTCQCAGGGVNN